MMLDETKPDILHIATPPETHLDIVKTAVNTGIKVIVCEKPLAENAMDVSTIRDFHLKGKAKIVVNHERRYSRDYLMAKNHIKKKKFAK